MGRIKEQSIGGAVAALTERADQAFDSMDLSMVGQRAPLARTMPLHWPVFTSAISGPLALTCVFNALLMAWLHWWPGAASELVVYLTTVTGAVFGALIAFLPTPSTQSARTYIAPKYRRIPLYLGLATLSVAIGKAFWVYDYQVAHLAIPFLALACALSFVAYPLVLVAILRLPRRHVPASLGSHVFVDSLMPVVGGATISWYFVLGPDLLRSPVGLVSLIIRVGYPFFDILLLSCLVVLTMRARDPSLVVPSWILGIGLSCIVFADSNYSYQLLHGSYVEGQFFVVGWPLGLMLIGVAARAIRSTVVPIRTSPPAPDLVISALWRLLLPNFPLPLLIGILILGWVRGAAPALQMGVAIGLVTVAVLSRVRQFLTMLDNRRLYAEAMRINEKLSEVNARLEELSTTDPLTGLPNHRALNVALDNELDRAHRFGHPFALLFIDLDHFKAINDAYGHPTGDAILREMAQTLREAFSSSSVVGRWGGEEFVALLPEASPISCGRISEDVRQAVASHQFASAGGHVTCSIGCAIYPADARSRDDLIGSADRALYVAKRLGRNQVRTVADPAVQALSASDAAITSREEASLIGTIEALAAMVNARDQYTAAHMHYVARLTLEIAVALGIPAVEARMLSFAAEVHDVGKVAIPDAILSKAGMLTSGEWNRVRTHPVVGAEVIGHIPGLASAVPIVLSHHERWDGTGYPQRLAGEAIPLGARIIAVADSFSAMTSNRPYHPAMSSDKALEEIRRNVGTQFDPSVVDAITRILATNPDLFSRPRTSRFPPNDPPEVAYDGDRELVGHPESPLRLVEPGPASVRDLKWARGV